MNNFVLDRKFGREAFGIDPGGYHAARPAYPDWVFEMLLDRGCLVRGGHAFEIGAGTGIATRRLLDLGADTLVAIEPDNRMADFLRRTFPDKKLTVMPSTFEDVSLPDNSFDFGFCATAFHWLNEEASLLKAGQLLRPGGWWAMVWNVFSNPNLSDPFHEATKVLLQGPASPADIVGGIPFALDTKLRLAAIQRTGIFSAVEHRVSEWSLVLKPEQVVALYATYSNINIREDKETILTELGRIARDEFNGKVTRNMTTSLYIAQRKSDLLP